MAQVQIFPLASWLIDQIATYAPTILANLTRLQNRLYKNYSLISHRRANQKQQVDLNSTTSNQQIDTLKAIDSSPLLSRSIQNHNSPPSSNLPQLSLDSPHSVQ